MSEASENLVLEHLRHIRSRVDSIAEDVGDIKHRLTSLESATARGRGELVMQQEEVYRQQGALDRMKERIERIEHRFDLLE